MMELNCLGLSDFDRLGIYPFPLPFYVVAIAPIPPLLNFLFV